RWMFVVARVSTHTCRPSLSSNRESRHQGSWFLPSTLTHHAKPCAPQAIRTSAMRRSLSSSASTGRRYFSSSTRPCGVQIGSQRWTSSPKRNKNRGGTKALSEVGISDIIYLVAELVPRFMHYINCHWSNVTTYTPRRKFVTPC